MANINDLSLNINYNPEEWKRLLEKYRIFPPESLRDRPLSNVHKLPVISAGVDMAKGPDIAVIATYSYGLPAAWVRAEQLDEARRRFKEMSASWSKKMICSAFGIPPDQVDDLIQELDAAMGGQDKALGMLKFLAEFSSYWPFNWRGHKLLPDWEPETTAQRRARKENCRQRRAAFLRKGKHGLKRPNGKRKAPHG